jgi:glycosyltransferase involved in cell wall biosynthesis
MGDANDGGGAELATPRVSVLMAVYNGEKYLREAIDSILGQTFKDFEFIIVEDGSTDRSYDIVSSYGDGRIRVVRNPANLGLIKSLNRGIEHCRGEYVARMDCDDRSLPERLSKQVAFMDSHPNVGASGTWVTHIDTEGRATGLTRTPVGARMAYDFWRPPPLIHPTAIIRRSRLQRLRYDAEALHAEDYDLWLRFVRECRLDNLAECLLDYRIHDESVSQRDISGQLAQAHKIFLKRVGLKVSLEEYVDLIGHARKMNPARRVALRRRLAGAIGQSYRHFLREDLEYAKAWLLPRLTMKVLKLQMRRITQHLRRDASREVLRESRRDDARPNAAARPTSPDEPSESR